MLPPQIENLITEISRLPGIGRRQATRLAFYLYNRPVEERKNLAQAVNSLKEVKVCRKCFNFSQDNLCHFCQAKGRNEKLVCVVEDMLDIVPIERTGQFKGVYHVLGGLISPTEGLTPEKLKLKELKERIRKEGVEEIMLAFNPTTEGDTTALYLERTLKDLPVKITRLGRGLSTGSDLEYTDDNTLTSAIIGRK